MVWYTGNMSTPDGAIDDMFGEAQRRLAKAKYFDILVKGTVFPDDNSQDALAATEEVRAFARRRIAELLGVVTPPVTGGDFTQQEVAALKALVNRTPVAGRAATPPAPAIATQPASPAPLPAPQPPVVNPPAPEVTGEKIVVPNADGTSREYTKVVMGGRELYMDGDGKKYLLMTNAKGESYMRNVSGQSRPSGAVPQPRKMSVLELNAMSALVAGKIGKNTVGEHGETPLSVQSLM